MAASAKFDLSSNSPDGSGYMNGQRGSYGASLDRSGSFREGSEGRIPSSVAGSSRSFSMLSQADAISLSQSLLPDLKLIVLDQKYPRYGDLRKLLASVIGVSQDDSSSHAFSAKGAPALSSEEFKRAKSSLYDCYLKAREWAKYYGELASRYDKYLSSNSTKKRSRSDMSSTERPSSLSSGVSMTKNATQIHPGSGALDPASQRSEERSKGVIPNRRIRTSVVMEQRPGASLKPCNTVGRERETVKIVSGNTNLAEEKPPGVGWDKAKMKKKRSSVKPDVSDQNMVIGRTTPGDRGAKHGLQQRLGNDAQPRGGNALGFRSNAREENPIGSPIAATNRSNTIARAPRSNGVPHSRASPSVRSSGSPEESDILPYTTKSNSGLASGNRKRSASAQSSSPPVTQWVGQRLHKRSARRPPVLGHDDNPFSDAETCIRTNDGVEPPRHASISSCQIKVIGEHAYSTGLSESEESAIVENKIKEKVKKCADLEEKAGQNLQRAAALSFPPRKNKTSGEGEDELGDGTRRLSRPARAFPPLRPGVHSSTEKLENASSANQPRSAKLDAERAECKPGRPITKKFQERKGYPRPQYEATGLQGEAEDDHEELLAAANYALNTRHACPNLFWKRVEPFFALISTEENSFLKKQSDLSLPTLQAKAARDDCDISANGVGIDKCDGTLGRPIETEHINELSLEDAIQSTEINSGISICQLLLSAMIEEVEESDPYCCKGREEECFSNDTCSTEFDTKANEMDHLPLENAQRVRPYPNGYIVNALRYYDEPNHHNLEIYNIGPEYNQMRTEDRILLELNEIGLSPEPMPDLAQSEDEEINEGIRRLEEKLHEEARSNRSMLSKLEKTVMEAKKSQERELERIALDKLVGIAYAKYVTLRGSSSSGNKNTNKITKHRVVSFVKRTLARCQAFEQTGKSCFSEPAFREMFQSINKSTTETEDADVAAGHSSLPSQPGVKSNKPDKYFDTVPINTPENALGKDELWSNKVKKRELLLNAGNLGSGTKGKRSDRDGKRSNRDAAARNGTSKVGRPALSNNTKGERKNKTKPKHKTTHLSASLSDLLGGDTLPSAPKPRESVPDGNTKQKDGSAVALATSGSQDVANDEPIDLSQLQLPGIDGLDSQPQDFGTWFNFDDDGLQDQDLVGLEIPMDDLSDLNMVL